MTTEINAYARIAGGLYLLIAIIAAFSIGYVPMTIVVTGDAAATTENLLANQGLFAAGLTGDVAIMLIEIALSVMLFILMRRVSPTLALITMIARLAEVMVMAINVLISTMALMLVGQAGEVAAPETQTAVMLLLDAHAYGIFVWDILFGFSLFFLGYLVIRATFLPQLLGWGMAIGSFGYMLEGLNRITFLENGLLGTFIVALLVIATVSELAFGVWLAVRGVKADAWRATRTALA